MNIYTANNEKENKVRYKLKCGASSESFRTKDNLVYKKFLDNKMYRKILDIHDNDFLAYLIELSKIENEAFVPIESVYVTRKRLVSSYTYPFQSGTTINEMYAKTLVDDFIDAVFLFYGHIRKIENLRLNDTHYRNIIYTGLLKLIDLDMCIFTNQDERKDNIAKLDDALFRGIFNLYPVGNVRVNDIRVKNMYDSLNAHEMDIVEFLKEYRTFIRKEYGNCRYLKHLKKGIIS